MTKTFGAFTALDDVSIDVKAGSFHALLGENGAGKSTLVKCIMGFYNATRGAVLLDGKEQAIRTPRDARELGIVSANTPMATTIHSLQLVPDEVVVIESHDSPLDYIATEPELIETGNAMPRPMGVAWDKVRADQFDTIPFLARLRDRMIARRAV